MPIDWAKPAQTTNGKPVRVLCTDGPGLYPVIGIVDGVGTPYTWTLAGIYCSSNSESAHLDLINVPEERFVNVWRMGNGRVRSGDVYPSAEEARGRHHPDDPNQWAYVGTFRLVPHP